MHNLWFALDSAFLESPVAGWPSSSTSRVPWQTSHFSGWNRCISPSSH